MNQSMPVVREVFANSLKKLADGDHVLTYAEEGFSPLSMFSEEFNIGRAEQKAFELAVTARDSLGTLYPNAPISAIPRRLIREPVSLDELVGAISEFLILNATTFQANRIYIDFGCPSNPPELGRAIMLAIEVSRPNVDLKILVVVR